MTIERPMFPPRGESVDSFSLQAGIGRPESQTLTGESRRPAEGQSAAILRFPRARPIARHYASTPRSEYEPRPLRYARNPLRQHVTALSIAIVEANKFDEFIDGDALTWIRKGIEAARILADELGGLVDRLEG
jgi:hypothetical protein